jgi:hypothetical protein
MPPLFPAKNCGDDPTHAITMLKMDYGNAEKMLKVTKAQKPVKNSNDFQEFSNFVENLSVTVDDVEEMAQFMSNVVIRGLLKKLPDNLRWQWAKIQQFADWVSVQNEIVSNVEIGTNDRG